MCGSVFTLPVRKKKPWFSLHGDKTGGGLSQGEMHLAGSVITNLGKQPMGYQSPL